MVQQQGRGGGGGGGDILTLICTHLLHELEVVANSLLQEVVEFQIKLPRGES